MFSTTMGTCTPLGMSRMMLRPPADTGQQSRSQNPIHKNTMGRCRLGSCNPTRRLQYMYMCYSQPTHCTMQHRCPWYTQRKSQFCTNSKHSSVSMLGSPMWPHTQSYRRLHRNWSPLYQTSFCPQNKRYNQMHPRYCTNHTHTIPAEYTLGTGSLTVLSNQKYYNKFFVHCSRNKHPPSNFPRPAQVWQPTVPQTMSNNTD